MQLSPHEQERLLVHVAADVASERRARGLKLNYPEVVAILTSWVYEAARDGRTVVDLMDAGRRVLTRDDVTEGIAEMVDEVQIGATFPDGTKLVTSCSPLRRQYTICPAVAHGLQDEIGSVEVGKLADLVLWDPRFFGVRTHAVLKGGVIASAAMGDPNASIPTPQPMFPRPMFGASSRVAANNSLTFVAPAALEDGLADRLQLGRRLVASASTRTTGKTDLPNNDAIPSITVDPDTFAVRIDGELITERPAIVLPMAQRYFLF